MMQRKSTVEVDSTPWGRRLPGKPYFPMYMANGTDAALINLMGSGDCYWEVCDYGAPLTLQRCAGWFKSDRRTHENTAVVYGTMVPLFEFSAAPMLNSDVAVPRNVDQYFCPRTATLTSIYDQLDIESGEPLRVKVTTFMASNHVLVEHYELLETPKQGASLGFFLTSPAPPHLDLYKAPVTMESVSLTAVPRQPAMRYEFQLDDLRGAAQCWVESVAATVSTEKRPGEQFVIGRMVTGRAYKHAAFTRYIAAIDHLDAPDYAAKLEETISETRALGYAGMLKRHQEEWSEYFGHSAVTVPDPSVQYLYDVSLYFMRANLHPSGFLPMGLFPYLWQGVVCWDTSFSVEALLGAGAWEEARRILEHLQVYLPEARQLAAAHGAPGARLEWTVYSTTFTRYHELVTQYHNNACWAHAIYLYYHYTGDLAFLKQNFGLMEELVIFLHARCLREFNGALIVGQCEGIDESISHPKVNDTWTAAAILKAMMDYQAAAEVLCVTPKISGLVQVIEKLQAGLDSNIDEAGVLQSFRGGRVPHWGSIIFDFFPEHPALEKTIAKLRENYDPKLGVYNMHGLNRYAEKSFPWAEYWGARCLARVGNPAALEVLRKVITSVNSFGGIPERVFYHGEFYNQWFLSAHSAMAWMLHGMLAVVTGRTLRLFGGVEQAWEDVSFDNIRAGSGLIVSAELKEGVLTRLRIVNLLPIEQDIQCAMGARCWQVRLALGENTLVPSEHSVEPAGLAR